MLNDVVLNDVLLNDIVLNDPVLNDPVLNDMVFIGAAKARVAAFAPGDEGPTVYPGPTSRYPECVCMVLA